MMATSAISDFEKLDIRVGTVRQARIFPEARVPAIQLWIDFGELGVKKSSAQITKHYTPETLVGTQVIAVVNFPPKQIGPFLSECLVLGAVDGEGGVILLQPERYAADGSRIK